MAEQLKIAVLEPLLRLGREELSSWNSTDVKQIKKTFTRHFVKAWWDQVVKWLEANEVGFGEVRADQSRSIEMNVGCDRETARRLLKDGGKQSVSIENYLATIVVFKANWPELEVHDPRNAVAEAMCQTLIFIQKLRRRHKQAAVPATAEDGGEREKYDSLSREQWEQLRKVFRSEEWRAAASIRDPEQRSQQLLQASDSIVRAFHQTQTDPSKFTADELVELVRHWLPAWIMFFAAVPCRWRF